MVRARSARQRPSAVSGLRVEVAGPAALRALLEQRGFSIKKLAELLGLKRSAVSGVVNGLWRSKRIESVIEALLCVPPGTLFGPKEPTRDSLADATPAVNVRVSTIRRRRPGAAPAEVPENRRIA